MQLESVLPSVLGAAGGEVRAGEERQDDGRAAHGQDGQQRKGRTGDTRGQLLRKTQVAPSGLFLVARTNFGQSYLARMGRGGSGTVLKSHRCPVVSKIRLVLSDF